MLTRADSHVARDRKQQAFEKQRSDTDGWIANQLRDVCYVEDKQLSVANSERQLGKPLTWLVFKKLVEEANFTLKVEAHPWKPGAVCVYKIGMQPGIIGLYSSGVKKDCLTVVDGPVITEWSIMSTKTIQVPTKARHLDPDTPGMMSKTIPYREEKRGWRTALTILVANKAITQVKAEDIARQYGSEDRQSWQSKIGKTSTHAPF